MKPTGRKQEVHQSIVIRKWIQISKNKSEQEKINRYIQSYIKKKKSMKLLNFKKLNVKKQNKTQVLSELPKSKRNKNTK